MLYALLSVPFFWACNKTSAPELEGVFENEIVNATWQLQYISENGYGVEATPVDSLFSITFLDDNTFLAKDNCNVCNGEYEVDSNLIEIKNNIICSLALCVSTKTNIQFGKELKKIETFELVDNELLLGYQKADTTRTLHLKKATDSSSKKVILTNREPFDRDLWETGSYQVELVRLAMDSLTLKVAYSGCNVKDLQMVFNTYFLESEPVQAYAFLPLVEQLCTAHFVEEYSFDLSPLKEAYFEGYPGNSGTIAISIRENEKTLEQFLYEF